MNKSDKEALTSDLFIARKVGLYGFIGCLGLIILFLLLFGGMVAIIKYIWG